MKRHVRVGGNLHVIPWSFTGHLCALQARSNKVANSMEETLTKIFLLVKDK